MINDDQCSHGLDNGDGTGDNARIVPSAGSEDSRSSVVLSGFLWLGDSSRGFEADPEVDILSVGDTALDTSAPVCRGDEDTVVSLDEHVVVPAARDLGSTEAGADLKRFSGGYRQHRVCQFGLKLVKTGFSEARRDIPDDAGDGSADRILSVFRADDSLRRIQKSEKPNREIRFGSRLPQSSSQRSLRGGTESGTCPPLPG